MSYRDIINGLWEKLIRDNFFILKLIITFRFNTNFFTDQNVGKKTILYKNYKYKLNQLDSDLMSTKSKTLKVKNRKCKKNYKR